MSKTTPSELLVQIVKACDNTKALDMIVIEMGELASFAENLVIASGSSNRQVQAIAENIRHAVKEKFGRLPIGQEGLSNAFWVLVDYGDIVCHIFTEEARAFYRLENLWHDAVRWDVKKILKPAAAKKKPAVSKIKPKEKAKLKPSRKPAPKKTDKKKKK